MTRVRRSGRLLGPLPALAQGAPRASSVGRYSTWVRVVASGVTMQDVTLAAESRVREHLTLFSTYYPHPRDVDELMRDTQLHPLADRPYGRLSGGQKRLVQFGIALCG